MTNEVGESNRTFMDVGKRHHRRGRNEEHRKLIHEVPDGGAGGLVTQVKPGRKVVLLDVQCTTEEAHFFGLGFEVLISLVEENEIEDGDAAFDEVELVLAAIAKVFLFDRPVEPSREEVINHAALGKALHASMSFGFELAPESGGPFAPMSAGEREELAGGEVTGVGCDNVEKVGFHFGVTEGFEGVEMSRCDVHSERIPAVSSRSSRMRRRREASSGRLYMEKPAAAFSAKALGRYSRVASSRSTWRASSSGVSYSTRISG